MTKLSKRLKAIESKVDRNKFYPLEDALILVKECATAKFDESIDVAVQLGIDAKKSDQVVRGAVVLPAGTGKHVRVAVFAQGEKAEQAKAAGAEIVGMEDLAEQIKGGKIDFDILIASPDTMKIVGTLGQVLGPRGLMPNPKVGTVTPDVATAVKNAKAGQVQFRVDKAGIVHASIGRRSFEPAALKSNLLALLEALNKAKPAASKGIYLRKVAVSSTMGAGVRVDQASLQAAALLACNKKELWVDSCNCCESRTSKTVGELLGFYSNKFLIITKVIASADGDPEKIFTSTFVNERSDAGV